MAASPRPEPGTAVVRQEEAKGLSGLLQSEQAQREIAPFAVAAGVPMDKVMAQVLVAARENPEIKQCTPTSILTAIARSVETGLVIGKEVYLIPRNVKVSKRGEPDQWEKRLTHQLDYKGEIALIRWSGAARDVDAQIVYANEVCEIEQGSHPSIRHTPIRHAEKRGVMVGAYAVARISFYQVKIHYMTVDEVDAIRQRYSQSWKQGPVPTWYMKKTCVHQIAKLLPKNRKLEHVLRLFEQEDREMVDGAPIAEVPAPAEVRRLGSAPLTGFDHGFAGYNREDAEGLNAALPGRDEPVSAADPYGLEDEELPLGDRRAAPEDRSNGWRDALREG